MANGNVFERALQISTPGFETLLQTIQQETDRIQRNQALAKEREEQFKTFAVKQDIQQQGEEEMLRLKDELQRSQLEFQADIEGEMLEAQTDAEVEKYWETVGEANKLKAQREAQKNFQEALAEAKEKQNELLEGEYKGVFGHVLPFPHLTAHRTDQGIQFFNQTQEGQLEPLTQTLKKAQYFKPLGDFINTISNPNNLASSPEGKDMTQDGNLLVTLENQDKWLKNFRNAPHEQKLKYVNQVRNGDIVAFTPSYKRQLEAGLDDEEEGDSDKSLIGVERAFRASYTNLFRNFRGKQIPLDPTILDKEGVEAPSINPQSNSPYFEIDKTQYGKVTELKKAYKNFLVKEGKLDTSQPLFELDSNGNLNLTTNEEDLRPKIKRAWKSYKAINATKNTLDTFANTNFDFPLEGDPDTWMLDFQKYEEVINSDDLSGAVKAIGGGSEDTESVQQILPLPPGSNMQTTLDSLNINNN